jgi:hypothetical protein
VTFTGDAGAVFKRALRAELPEEAGFHRFQSGITVFTDTPSTPAVSSTVGPQEDRGSITRFLRSSMRASACGRQRAAV